MYRDDTWGTGDVPRRYLGHWICTETILGALEMYRDDTWGTEDVLRLWPSCVSLSPRTVRNQSLLVEGIFLPEPAAELDRKPSFLNVYRHLLCPRYCHCTSPVPHVSSLYISCAPSIVTVHLLCPKYRHCTSPVPQVSSLYISCAPSIVSVHLHLPQISSLDIPSTV